MMHVSPPRDKSKMENPGTLEPTALDRLEALRQACPAVFYRPNTAADEDWIVKQGGTAGTKSKGDKAFFESLARRRINIGGNRAGKTTKLCLEAGSFCVGRRPWYPQNNEWSRKGLKFKTMPAYKGKPYSPITRRNSGPRKAHDIIAPARVRYVIPNFQTHLPEVIKEFEKWWPKEWWDIKSRDAQGTAREFKWFNGSWIGFMSHKMNPEDFEGIEADLIVWDEPPPRNIWVALERGIVSTGGRSIIGATLLDASSWFWNEIVIPVLQGDMDPEDMAVTFHSIWDNSAENGGCPEQTVSNIRSWLQSIPDPDERLAREHGIPVHLGGLVLSSLKKECVIEPFELPKVAYIVSAIDPAGTRPFAALHIAYVVSGGTWTGYIFDETWIPQTRNDLGEFCRVFNDKEAGETDPWHPTASQIIMIDPFAEELQKADAFGRSMRRILSEDYEIHTQKANRQGKRARLLSLNAAFGQGKYKIFGNCTRFRQEARRWSWDQKSAKLTSGPDDLCDCLSYIHSLNPSKLLETAEGEQAGVWVPKAYREREDRVKKFQRIRKQRVDQGYEFKEKVEYEEKGYQVGKELTWPLKNIYNKKKEKTR